MARSATDAKPRLAASTVARKSKGASGISLPTHNGFLLALKVHSAQEHDGKAGYDVLNLLKHKFERLRTVYADGGYRGWLVD